MEAVTVGTVGGQQEGVQYGRGSETEGHRKVVGGNKQVDC